MVVTQLILANNRERLECHQFDSEHGVHHPEWQSQCPGRWRRLTFPLSLLRTDDKYSCFQSF